MSKSVTKGPEQLLLSNRNRGIMRFYLAHSALVTAFVTDLDTPHRSTALCTSGATWEVAFTSVTIARAHPNPDGTPYITPPSRPSRGPSWCCRADQTSTDQVAGSCGRSRSDWGAWSFSDRAVVRLGHQQAQPCDRVQQPGVLLATDASEYIKSYSEWF